ncbi:MAG TPA: malto-oligosyltrehalose synthase [Acidobacteriaceae bacterium]|jgi:(1->4)-alpha-D-glucan 1-alpha-D-glucosylmutase
MDQDCIHSLLQTDVRVPIATYRAQMHRGFPFDQAAAIVPYLQRLGMGDFYASPISEARPGSMHGYDIIRHDRLNPELGGAERFGPFAETLREHGMGLLLDIVPNHMGIGRDSVWWQDVLENGHASRYANFFDIDWNPLKQEMRNKLLLPILGNQYGEELEAGHIQVALEDGRFYVKYYDQRMPASPRSIPLIFFRRPIGTLPGEQETEDMPPGLAEVLRELTQLPPHETTDPQLQADRQQRLAALLPRLRAVLTSEEAQPAIARALRAINGTEGDAHSFDALDEFLNVQPYRLAYWRTSAEEINYRRFFDINDLVGLRMETPEVFAETHCLIRELLAKKQVTGLRIDHCDGMFNPRQYLIRLQLLYLASQCAGPRPESETAANGIERAVLDQVRGYDWSASHGPLYVVVEKILEPREHMPQEWPVHGTSGYDFVYFANNIFIQRENLKAFNTLYERVLGHSMNPDLIIYRSKLQVMQSSLASEVHVLTNMLSKIAAADRHARDFTDNILEGVIRETIACFPVYRTYTDERGMYPERDIGFIQSAIRQAKRRNPDIDASAFDFLCDMLLLRPRQKAAKREPDPQQLRFALKFQQLTGPVMAKGVEDTTFYVYNRFLSSNEVGGDTRSFGITLEQWHASNQERLEVVPDSMLTTSTHDTKRSEDMRNRLNVLSEIPNAWAGAVRRWQRANAKAKRTLADGRVAPDANEEYLLYQTIAGVWPWREDEPGCRESVLKRLQEYAAKALSEAKVNLSWINPDPEYVAAVQGFLAQIILPDKRGRETAFMQTLQKLLPQIKVFGAVNSLAQLVLKATCPGVPDFYQGMELWDLSLVDPDNRRPVDYALRERMLAHLDELAAEQGPAAVAAEVTHEISDGAIKLWTTAQVLRLRREEHALFRHGSYLPLYAAGAAEPHLIAHARQYEEKTVIVAVPRFACSLMRGEIALTLGKAWKDWSLSLLSELHGGYRNIFTGETISAETTLPLAEVFDSYPVAVLVKA